MSFDPPRRHSSTTHTAPNAIPPAPPLPPQRPSNQDAKLPQTGILDRILYGARRHPPRPPPLTARELKGQLLFTPNFG